MRVDRLVLVISLCLFFPSTSRAFDTGPTCLSCVQLVGSLMIHLGDTLETVEAKCGGRQGFDIAKGKRAGDERWNLNCGAGNFGAVLIFTKGKLTEIRKTDRHGSGPQRCW